MFRGSIILTSFFLVMALTIIGCGGGGGGGNPVGQAVGPAVTTRATASLNGTVMLNNAPLANAAVFLYKSEKAHTLGMVKLPALRDSQRAQQQISDGAYSTTSNAAGAYSFTNIPVGKYTLIAVKDENNQFAQTGVLLGAITTLNAQLTPNHSHHSNN